MQSKTKSYKVIFIDWNRTLSNSLFWQDFTRIDHEFHHYDAIIFNWLFKENKHILFDWMRGKLTAEQVCDLVSTANNLDYEVVFNELTRSAKEMEFVSDHIPDLIRKIRKNGYRVAIATDNMDTFMRFTVPAMELDNLFDDILSSFELQTLKEDYEDDSLTFFNNYFAKHKLTNSDAILLDDFTDKTGVFKASGFDTVQITDADSLLNELNKYAA
jgi:FMN phosphatase YigB (HAD superfamily)